MATKPQAIENESAHFNNFRKFLPAFTDRCDKTIDHLLKLGIIQVSTAFEQAIATVADCTIVNENRYDLSDGSECKMATTQYHRGQVDAQIRGITGKDGTLCVHIYEQFSKILSCALIGGMYAHFYDICPVSAESFINQFFKCVN